MGVQITDPPTNSVFPDPDSHDWTAYVVIDSADAVDGTLFDYNPNNQQFAYPSAGPTCTGGPDANGLYTWQIPFTHDGILTNDPLVIYCYDAEINGPGASCADKASEDGYSSHEHEQRKLKTRDSAPSIDSVDATVSGITVSVKVKLTSSIPLKKVGTFLVLASNCEKGKDIRKLTKRIQVCCLPHSNETELNYTFQVPDIDAPDSGGTQKWTHIHVVAVTHRHQAKPKAKRIRP